METNYTLQDIQNDLVATLYCMAFTLDLQIRQGAGASMLGLDSSLNVDHWPPLAEFDLSQFDVANGLKTVYRYAFHAELENAWISEDNEEGNLGRLHALLEIVENGHIKRNMEDIETIHGENHNGGGLAKMVALAEARYNLDYSQSIALSDIALLANINERSVRNALHAEGESMLAARRTDSGDLVVEKWEALRWLRTKRNFKETVKIGSWIDVPEVLSSNEIMPFLNTKLREGFSAWNESELSEAEIQLSRYEMAAWRAGLSGDKLRKILDHPIDQLSPNDCPILAQIFGLDTAWLTAQVMRARFPEAMKELQPHITALQAPAMSPFDEANRTLSVTLTDAGIRNGYLDIERRYADRFFPSDCFGSRGGDQPGQTISLHHDSKGSPYVTDLRVKSEALVSPRKRFSAYFTAHSAKAGDVIQIKQTGNRVYELIFLNK